MADAAQTTGERPISKTRMEIVREAKRMEENLLLSSKGHFAASHGWANYHLWIGIPVVVLSAIAGAAALAQFDNTHVVAGVLSITVAALSGIMTFLNPNEKVSAHFNAGNSYDALMGRVRLFSTIDCWGDESDGVLTERLKNLSEQRDNLNQKCPQIPRWAYRIAKAGIAAGEGTYKVDQTPTPQIAADRQ